MSSRLPGNYPRITRWEFIRLQKFQQCDDICRHKLVELKREHFEDWITERLRQVKSSTVNRELNLISHCLTQARCWRLMAHEPLKDLKRPKNLPPRFRRISEHEIQQLCIVLGYREDIEIKFKRQFVAVAFLFAIETAMRAGEICMLTKKLVDTKAAVAHLPDTKNSGRTRTATGKSVVVHLIGNIVIYAPLITNCGVQVTHK